MSYFWILVLHLIFSIIHPGWVRKVGQRTFCSGQLIIQAGEKNTLGAPSRLPLNTHRQWHFHHHWQRQYFSGKWKNRSFRTSLIMETSLACQWNPTTRYILSKCFISPGFLLSTFKRDVTKRITYLSRPTNEIIWRVFKRVAGRHWAVFCSYTSIMQTESFRSVFCWCYIEDTEFTR